MEFRCFFRFWSWWSDMNSDCKWKVNISWFHLKWRSGLTSSSWLGCCCSASRARIRQCRGWWWARSPSGTAVCSLWTPSWGASSPGGTTTQWINEGLISRALPLMIFGLKVCLTVNVCVFTKSFKSIWEAQRCFFKVLIAIRLNIRLLAFHRTCPLECAHSRPALPGCEVMLWWLHLLSQPAAPPHSLCRWMLAWSHLRETDIRLMWNTKTKRYGAGGATKLEVKTADVLWMKTCLLQV